MNSHIIVTADVKLQPVVVTGWTNTIILKENVTNSTLDTEEKRQYGTIVLGKSHISKKQSKSGHIYNSCYINR